MNVSFLTALRVFVPFAGGYFLSYLYRVVNAVIAPDLVIDLGIGPSALGLLTSTYFIAFASSQLPLGVLLDRFGPRRVEAFLLLFAGLGAFLFSWSGTLAGLVAARAFIGFGVSACLMAAFKAYTLWFAREKWPLVNGFQMAAGGFGALAATAPVESALHHTDWRGLFMVLAVLTLVVAVAMIAGFILLGSLAERLSRAGISVLATSVIGMSLFMVVQLMVASGWVAWVLPVWVLFGFFGTSGIIAYAALSQRFPVQLSGRVTTSVNLLVFVAAFIGQWAIGAIIGHWPVGADGTYALAGYRTAFSVMLVLQAMALIWFLIAGRLLRKREVQ
jgi:MFS family permease